MSATTITPTTAPDKLQGFLQSIGSASEDMVLTFIVEHRLYHYTSLEGLEGIVSGNDLWLTHTQYCNDDEELTHGLSLTRQVIAEQAESGDDRRKEYLNKLLKLLERPELDAVYVCCFCEKDDLLSQWRAYAANGGGVSLEFEPARFNYITGPDCPPSIGLMRFWKVFYPLETQQKIIRSAISYYPQFEPNATTDEHAQWTAEAIRFFLPTFKNDSFQEEKEWRLIFTPAQGSPAQPSYRVRRGMLVAYYSLKELASNLALQHPKLPITGVRIGPGPNKALNAASTRMFLDRQQYPEIGVDVSEAPYRSW